MQVQVRRFVVGICTFVYYNYPRKTLLEILRHELVTHSEWGKKYCGQAGRYRRLLKPVTGKKKTDPTSGTHS